MMTMTRNESRQVRYTLEKFAKRSKYITITYTHNGFGILRMDIQVEKENKVVREMKDYLHSLCYFYHEDKERCLDYTYEWFRNYDDLAEEDFFYHGLEFLVKTK